MANFRWQVGGCGCDCGCETCTVSWGADFSELPAIAENYYQKNATPLSVEGVVSSSNESVFPFNTGDASVASEFNNFQRTNTAPPFTIVRAFYLSNKSWTDDNNLSINQPDYQGEFALGRNCSKTSWGPGSPGGFQCGANFPQAGSLTITRVDNISSGSITGPSYNSESSGNPTLPAPLREYSIISVSVESVSKVSGPTSGYNVYEVQFSLKQKVRTYFWDGVGFSDPKFLFEYPESLRYLYSCATLDIGGGLFFGSSVPRNYGIVSIGGASHILRPLLLGTVNTWSNIPIEDEQGVFPIKSVYASSSPTSIFIPEAVGLYDANGNNSLASDAYWGDFSSFNDGGLYTSNGALYHSRGYIDVIYTTKSTVQFSLYRNIVNNAAYWPSVETITSELESKIPTAYNNYSSSQNVVPGDVVFSFLFRAFTFSVTGAIGVDGTVSFPLCPDL